MENRVKIWAKEIGWLIVDSIEFDEFGEIKRVVGIEKIYKPTVDKKTHYFEGEHLDNLAIFGIINKNIDIITDLMNDNPNCSCPNSLHCVPMENEELEMIKFCTKCKKDRNDL